MNKQKKTRDQRPVEHFSGFAVVAETLGRREDGISSSSNRYHAEEDNTASDTLLQPGIIGDLPDKLHNKSDDGSGLLAFLQGTSQGFQDEGQDIAGAFSDLSFAATAGQEFASVLPENVLPDHSLLERELRDDVPPEARRPSESDVNILQPFFMFGGDSTWSVSNSEASSTWRLPAPPPSENINVPAMRNHIPAEPQFWSYMQSISPSIRFSPKTPESVEGSKLLHLLQTAHEQAQSSPPTGTIGYMNAVPVKYSYDSRIKQRDNNERYNKKHSPAIQGNGLNMESTLTQIYNDLLPSESEERAKQRCFRTVQKILLKKWPKSQLCVFGSSANGFSIRKNNDIDFCLDIDRRAAEEGNDSADEEEEKYERKVVTQMAKLFRKHSMKDILPLAKARVPIVKFTEPNLRMKCDVGVNNILGFENTKLLALYSAIDGRVRPLVILIKHWAKRRKVNETFRGTLSSYAYALMAIYSLQTSSPAILPCLQSNRFGPMTVKKKIGPWEVYYNDNIESLKGFGRHNRKHVGDLLYDFFQYWAYQHRYKDRVISIRTGGWLYKSEKGWTTRKDNDNHLICIEDPFQTSNDLGRVVSKRTISTLRQEFERAAKIMDSSQDVQKIVKSLFKEKIEDKKDNRQDNNKKGERR